MKTPHSKALEKAKKMSIDVTKHGSESMQGIPASLRRKKKDYA